MNYVGDPPTREGIKKLVEETAIYFQAYRKECRFDPTIPDRSRDYAAKSITRTLAAVRDGKAKIPGEARRTWLDEFEGYCEEEYGTHQVIILFPEDLARYNEEAEAKRRGDEKAE